MTRPPLTAYQQYLADINHHIDARADEQQPGTVLTFKVGSTACRRCGSPISNGPDHVGAMKLPDSKEYSDPHLGQIVAAVWAKCLRPTCRPDEQTILNAIGLIRAGHCNQHRANFMAASNRADAWRRAHRVGDDAN